MFSQILLIATGLFLFLFGMIKLSAEMQRIFSVRIRQYIKYLVKKPFSGIGIGAVATFGIKFKTEQIQLLKNFKRRFIFFDTETIAKEQAEKLANMLSGFSGDTEIIEYPVDAGDMKQDDADSLMRDLGIR